MGTVLNFTGGQDNLFDYFYIDTDNDQVFLIDFTSFKVSQDMEHEMELVCQTLNTFISN